MNESVFACPVCGGALCKNDKVYSCKKGHCFDIAATGHVNLLTADQMHSREPGDDKMMVAARSRFLANGYYEPLKYALQRICGQLAGSGDAILDLGCGEGYYTNGVLTAITAEQKHVRMAGIDISKAAAKLAAKKNKEAEIAVASVFHLPIEKEAVNLMLNCFSPLCIEEIVRGLAQGGYFVYVVPAARHLWGLKTVLYKNPYENECKQTPYKALEYITIEHVNANINLKSAQDIQNLFTMTPYFWKTSLEDKSKLDALTSLDTEIAFDIHIYQKQRL